MPSSVSTDAAVTFQVAHLTRYAYSAAVSVSHHLARVTPRVCPGQECLAHDADRPQPTIVRSHQDYFGNAVDFFIVERRTPN